MLSGHQLSDGKSDKNTNSNEYDQKVNLESNSNHNTEPTLSNHEQDSARQLPQTYR